MVLLIFVLSFQNYQNVHTYALLSSSFVFFFKTQLFPNLFGFDKPFRELLVFNSKRAYPEFEIISNRVTQKWHVQGIKVWAVKLPTGTCYRGFSGLCLTCLDVLLRTAISGGHQICQSFYFSLQNSIVGLSLNLIYYLVILQTHFCDFMWQCHT